MWDDTPPAYANASPIAIQWSASDVGSGIDSVSLWYRHNSASWIDSGLSQSGTSGTFNFSPPDGEGSYYFATVGVDKVGNSEATPSGNGDATTIYDTTGPTVSLEVEATADPNIFNISWSPGAGETDIASYTVQYRDVLGQWLDWTAPSGSAFAGEPGQTYVFRAQATDNVGIPGDWTTSQPFASAASVTKYYSHGGSKVAMRKGDAIYYLHGDHLGSTSLTTDASGDVVYEARYHPFGELRHQSGQAVTDFGFTSQRESNFGLMDYNARFYSVYLNRFISPDSIVPNFANPQSLNRYSYVLGNPLKYIDPSGHCWGPASALRGTFYGTTCDNLDMAIAIAGHSDTSAYEKAQAVAYVEAVAISHLVLLEGLAMLGTELIPALAKGINELGQDRGQDLGQMDDEEVQFLQQLSEDYDITFTVTGKRSETNRGLDNRRKAVEKYGPGVEAPEFGVPAWRNKESTGANEFDYFVQDGDLPNEAKQRMQDRYGQDVEFDNWDKLPGEPYRSRGPGGIVFDQGNVGRNFLEPWQ